jgi:hypothetical protein
MQALDPTGAAIAAVVDQGGGLMVLSASPPGTTQPRVTVSAIRDDAGNDHAVGPLHLCGGDTIKVRRP